ncbi:hypothetical protein SAMN05192583_1253 [Sphingomonas gellani]|uniref:DUF1488 domain-containing protein n=1 Tax=Sphingomonas gellani TaxID=1166340 RepID=A0A1H8B967_9SPHN|nr:hypothetical protein [Sphingomonas gellani]SEM79236.1 hypothetical protein SAMN05192583_1253 [Sphingomonas gellani]
MTDPRITIDPASLFDNVDERQVEFSGDADSDRYRFALRYDVVEALAGTVPQDGDAVAQVRQHLPRIEPLAARALARDYDQDLVVISENDLA